MRLPSLIRAALLGLPPLRQPARMSMCAAAPNLAGKRSLGASTTAHMSASASSAILDWPGRVQNTLLTELRAEDAGLDPTQSRQVRGAHYTRVRPTVSAPDPALVIYSAEVAESLGLTPDDCETDEFLALFSGNTPDNVESWATAYGASFTGQYGGQRGDGRAISIGQVGDLEVQLKGAGVTPFSRRFDGRAVLRSTVREFLASEAMHALRVPTTRALCVVTTGGERVRRAWYDDKGREKLSMELGAVGTRVASSFLRFGQMELFYQNDEYELLRELAEHALMRDFGYLKVQSPEGPFSEHLIAMFEEICERQAKLVAEWIRVGYCQGNMNSDNSALNGVTLDYGPFAFMEKFNPTYNPWVGGGQPYCFGMQPQAAAINLSGLSAPFVELVERAAKDEGLSASDIRERIERVRACVSHTYVDTFDKTHDANCRDKLGLSTWDDEAQQLWDDLFRLMSVAGQYGGVDFTLLFRGLTDMLPPSTADGAAGNGGVVDAAGAADAAAGDDDDALLGALRAAALSPIDDWTEEHRGEWVEWHQRYWRRIAAEGRSAAERREVMARTNPKYIPRNWMMLEAYEAAERGDYELIAEIHHVLRSPYEEQSADVAQKWAQLTPHWARDRAGVAFMS